MLSQYAKYMVVYTISSKLAPCDILTCLTKQHRNTECEMKESHLYIYMFTTCIFFVHLLEFPTGPFWGHPESNSLTEKVLESLLHRETNSLTEKVLESILHRETNSLTERQIYIYIYIYVYNLYLFCSSVHRAGLQLVSFLFICSPGWPANSFS